MFHNFPENAGADPEDRNRRIKVCYYATMLFYKSDQSGGSIAFRQGGCMLEFVQEDPETITTYTFECDDDDFYIRLGWARRESGRVMRKQRKEAAQAAAAATTLNCAVGPAFCSISREIFLAAKLGHTRRTLTTIRREACDVRTAVL